MRSILIISALIFMTATIKAQDANTKLLALFDKYDDYNRNNSPENATYNGDHRFDDQLDDLSEEANLKYFDKMKEFLAELKTISYGELTEDNKLNYDLFKSSMDETLESEKFHWWYTPIGQQWGIHIGFPQLVNTQPVSTYEEYQKYFKRLRAFDKQVNDVITNIRKGMKEGIVPPRIIIEQTLPQMENVMNVEPENSVFYSVLANENTLTDGEKSKVSAELKEIIINDINPDYKKLHDFVKNEYLPVCRNDVGVWAMPDGGDRYKFAIKSMTTLDMTPDEIHSLGLKEVERIRGEMEKLKNQIGYNGTLDEFNNYIKTDPQFFYTDKKDLLDGFRTILNKMDGKLPTLFGRLPQAKWDLFEMEEYRAKSAPAAYYYSAPEDRSRPGYFYVNTYNLSARPKYTMTSLALHECIPGHHLQISIAQELKNLPKFRRDYGVTSFVEGWALYAEYLGYESGMYEDLYQRYGALTFEMWRACRLVIDTGLHSNHWTREEAYQYMRKNTPNSDQDIQSEIDRYISWPGQALAYKLGELKIKELRKMAENKLGAKFDVKEFHDRVLENGAIPLPLLEKKINQWVEEKLK